MEEGKKIENSRDVLEWKGQPLKVTMSIHGQPCIEIVNPPEKVREVIRRAVASSVVGEEAYQLNRGAMGFLQSYQDNYILVEFWQKDYQPFVDYLNKILIEEGLVQQEA